MSEITKQQSKLPKKLEQIKQNDQIAENRNQLDELTKTNLLLNSELQTEKKQFSKTSQVTTSKIAKLQESALYYAQRIESETQKLREINEEIRLTEGELKNKKELLRKIDGGQVGMLAKQIKQKENELDKKLQRYNEALAYNKQLRTQINHLRKERTLFDNVYNQLEVDILNKKNELIHLIEASEKAEKTKEEYTNKLQIIKHQAEKEQEQFQKGYEIILGAARNDSKTKWDDQNLLPNSDQIRSSIIKPVQHNSIDKVVEVQEEHKKIRASNKSPVNSRKKTNFMRSLDINNDSLDEAAQKVEEYKQMFQRLKAETGQNDIESIINYFKDAEDINHNLFLQVNQLNSEIESIEQLISSTQNEINGYTNIPSPEDDKKMEQIRELDKKIKEEEQISQNMNKKLNELDQTFYSLKDGIPVLLEKLGCNTEEYLRDLIKANEINDSNIIQFLTVIEGRANEIIEVYKSIAAQAEIEESMHSGKDTPNVHIKNQGEEQTKVKLANDHISQINEILKANYDSKIDDELIINHIDIVRDKISQEVEKKLGEKSKGKNPNRPNKVIKRTTLKY